MSELPTPTLNIITRTSKRPAFFQENHQSIKQQTYTNWIHICGYDNLETSEYLFHYDDCIKVSVMDLWTNRKNSKHFPYNLYCNRLQEHVKSGWVMFLDDDDIYNENAFETIVKHANCPDKLLIWRTKFPDPVGIIPTNRVFGKRITKQGFSAIGFAFHSKYLKEAVWDDQKGADGRLIYKLSKIIPRICWIDKVLTKINYDIGHGGWGKQKDKIIRHNSQNNKEHNSSMTTRIKIAPKKRHLPIETYDDQEDMDFKPKQTLKVKKRLISPELDVSVSENTIEGETLTQDDIGVDFAVENNETNVVTELDSIDPSLEANLDEADEADDEADLDEANLDEDNLDEANLNEAEVDEAEVDYAEMVEADPKHIEPIGNVVEAEDDNESEYEQVLNPQLQELLECMADDERVFIIKESQLKAVSNIMKIALDLKDEYDELVDKLTKLNTHTKQNIELPTVLPEVLEQNPTNRPKSLPHLIQPSEKLEIPKMGSISQEPYSKPKSSGGLAEILQNFNKKSEDLNEGVTDGSADSLNTFFDAIYILNTNGTAVELGEKLQEMGIQSCKVIDSELPRRVPSSLSKDIYYLQDTIDDAESENYERILVLSDDVKLHKNLLLEFNEFVDNLSSLSWNIIQLGFSKKVNFKRAPSNFDWKYYSGTFRELELSNEQMAVRHWKKYGFKEGRIGSREVVEDNTIDSRFAFAASKDSFEDLSRQIKASLKNNKSINLFDRIKTGLYGIKPNLFIKELPAGRRMHLEYAKNQWYQPCYDI